MNHRQLEEMVRQVDVMRQASKQEGPTVIRTPCGQIQYEVGNLSARTPHELGHELLEGCHIDPASVYCPEDLFVTVYDVHLAGATWERIMGEE